MASYPSLRCFALLFLKPISQPTSTVAALFLLLAHSIAFGQTPATESTKTLASSQADKSQYTLFHPTPPDQLRPMATDRPNITNTPTTIDAGHVQLEAGIVDYAYDRDRYQGADADINGLSVGQFNFRLGVLNNLELNAAVDSYDFVHVHDKVTGINKDAGSFGDTVVGGKINFWGNELGEKVWDNAFAIQPQFKFPTARSDVGNGRFEALVNFPFIINLPRGFHLAYQPAVLYERSIYNTGCVAGMQNAICVDHMIGKWIDVFAEYAVEATSESHVKAPQIIDVGCAYALSDNITFDTDLNFGLNNAANNFELLAGVNMRF